MTLWGYFIGTIVGSFIGVFLARAVDDIIQMNNEKNRRR